MGQSRLLVRHQFGIVPALIEVLLDASPPSYSQALRSKYLQEIGGTAANLVPPAKRVHDDAALMTPDMMHKVRID